MDSDGGSGFRKHIAHDIAHYAYHYKVLEAKLEVTDRVLRNYGMVRRCQRCNVPVERDHVYPPCVQVHDAGVHCYGARWCGRPWCSPPEPCSVCTIVSCTHLYKCDICGKDGICEGCIMSCPNCDRTMCGKKHTWDGKRCQRCIKRRIKYVRQEIFHLEERHGYTETLAACSKCKKQKK